MFAYWVISRYSQHQGKQVLELGLGQNWSTFEPGTARIYVHPHLDYHAINGQLFLDNKITTLVECQDGFKLTHSGAFVLARNYKAAMELLRP